ncbi:MAG: ribosome biogenesis GTPase Der [Candidatus Magasanikbacteria bacterium]|nr:ribosome biogenesis GTPase Der [Candidatus Magasanikbacteria bacterium]
MPTPAQIIDEQLPTIALVGRVNVGKSTLFNKLIEQEKALVSKIPGTTRTRNEGEMLWRGQRIKLVDTGGLTFTDDVLLEEEIIEQSEKALKEADVILFITDAHTGILPQEKELAKLLLRNYKDKPIMLLANKVDSTKIERDLRADKDWFKLGFGAPFPVSAVSGRNVGDFLDKLYNILDAIDIKPKDYNEIENIINISVIGKPNVGKSSLFNKIIGEDKVIISDMAHTTREPFDTLVTYTQKVGDEDKIYNLNFIDTAGIRRKARVKGFLERKGIIKSIDYIDKSDLVLFVLDGSEPISSQDRQLGGLLERRAKSVIIIVNKWDLAEDNSQTNQINVKKMVYSHFPHLNFAPIVFTSGLSGEKTHKLFPELIKIWDARHTFISRGALKVFIESVTRQHKPSRGKGTRQPKILGFRQIAENPPVFELAIKHKTSLHRSYMNFIENRLREQFNFIGTPIIIKLRKAKM